MEEEIVHWNLRGPKRMKKRKELNALVKNNVRYKSLFKHNSAIDMFNLNTGANRLLGKSNESSTDNEDYYFSANKQLIRERKRRNCCKLIQITILGFIVTFALIAGLTLAFSYTKFHEALKELKIEFQFQKEQSELSISEVKRKLNEYDAIFKSDNKAVLNNTNNRPIRSVNLKNQLNSFLIEYLFNQTNAENRQQTTNLADLVLKNTKKAGGNSNFDNYQNLVDNFLRNKGQTSLNLKDSFSEFPQRDELLRDIEILYIKPILETLETCNCPSSKLLNISLSTKN